MKKILLVAVDSKFIHSNLALRYIKGYIKKHGDFESEIAEYTINNHINDIIGNIYLKKPEIIAFSVYIWNYEYIMKLIIELKKVMPKTQMILGGPEVSYNAREIMEARLEVDAIICGEGEKAFLDYLQNGKSGGVFYRENGIIIDGGTISPIENLDEIPFPYKSDEIEHLKNRLYYYESSRGCPYSCTYCMSSIEKRVRYFSIERVKSDLRFFLENNIKLVKFVDRTFNLDKNRYMEIWRFLLENYNEKCSFHFEISADLFDVEVLDFLEKVPKDYFQFEVGVQSTNKDALEAVKRKTDLDKLEKNVRRVMKNIHTHLDLIAGLPYEDYNSFRESFDFVYKLEPDMLQLGFLKILKGTEIELKREEHDYKYLDFSPYEILSNKYMSYSEIIKLKQIEEILDLYYNSGKFAKSMKYIISNFYESAFDLYFDLADFFVDKNLFYISHKDFSLFNYLYEFYQKNIKKNLVVFKEVLKYDYLLMAKSGRFPDWMILNKDKELYNGLISELDFKSTREAHKNTEFECFSYDIIENKEGKIGILFNYRDKTTKKVVLK